MAEVGTEWPRRESVGELGWGEVRSPLLLPLLPLPLHWERMARERVAEVMEGDAWS